MVSEALFFLVNVEFFYVEDELLLKAVFVVVDACKFLETLLYAVAYLLYALAYISVAIPILTSTVKGLRKGRIFDENFLMMIATFGACGLFVGILGSWTSIRKFLDV